MPQNSGMPTSLFGRAVTEARAALGVDQQSLADAIGMKRSYLSKIENGHVKVPSNETQERVAAGLGLTIDALMEYAGPSLRRMIEEYDRPYGFEDVEPSELLAIFSLLPAPDRDRLVAIARALFQLSRE